MPPVAEGVVASYDIHVTTCKIEEHHLLDGQMPRNTLMALDSEEFSRHARILRERQHYNPHKHRTFYTATNSRTDEALLEFNSRLG